MAPSRMTSKNPIPEPLRRRHRKLLLMPLMPCPRCHGTTDIDIDGFCYCHSCDAQWSLRGRPR